MTLQGLPEDNGHNNKGLHQEYGTLATGQYCPNASPAARPSLNSGQIGHQRVDCPTLPKTRGDQSFPVPSPQKRPLVFGTDGQRLPLPTMSQRPQEPGTTV